MRSAIMYGSSKEYPAVFVSTSGLTQFRYNIREVTKDFDGQQETFYKYDYVEFAGEATRKALIDALIRARHDANDEFALAAKPHDSAEYLYYRNYVDECKAIADAALK